MKVTLFTSATVCALILSVLFAAQPSFTHAALAPTAAPIPPVGDTVRSIRLSSFALPVPAYFPDRIKQPDASLTKSAGWTSWLLKIAGPDAWKAYVDGSYGITLKYLSSWQASRLNESRADSTVLFHGAEGDVYLRVYAPAVAPLSEAPLGAAATVAGLAARRVSIPGGQNPPQDIVTFVHGGNQFELQFVHANDSVPVFEQMLDSIAFPAVLAEDSTPLEPMRLAWTPCSTSGGGWGPFVCYSSLPSTGWCTQRATIEDAGFPSIGVYSNGTGAYGMNGCMDTYNLKFQCVELAQRYYAIRHGMPPIWPSGAACNMWNQYPDKFESRPNDGNSPPPARGDLIIWGCPNGGYGHVAIAAGAPSGGKVYFYQQNTDTAYGNRTFSGGRIQESNVVGWMHWIGDDVYYFLTAGVTGDGSVSKNPDQAHYEYGDVVTLTAIPGEGQAFTGWSGALSGLVNPKSITMTGNKTVTATFDVIRPLTGAFFTIAPSGPKRFAPVAFTRVITPANATLPVTYTWSFGDGSAQVTTRSSSVSHSFNLTGTYTVWMTATNGYSASVVTQRSITVTDWNHYQYFPAIRRES
jgi:Divergent InlB B-repeat domain/PKD domain/CHAP domain